jgi:enamine deaminase RidA (YjgF/YER057c/UK114 family)
MSESGRSADIARRSFLGGASAAGVASLLPSSPAHAQAASTKPAGTASSITPIVANNFVGSGVNYAHTVKAGPFIFINGHEAYDFATGPVQAVEGPAGFADFGRPKLRRESDYLLERMGKLLKSFGTDFAHGIRLDQYYTDPNSTRAYHLARFANMGNYIPPSTSIITEGCFGAKSTVQTSLIALVPDPQWRLNIIRPPGVTVSPTSGYAPAVVANEFVFTAGTGPNVKDMLTTDEPGGPTTRWRSQLPIRRQTESHIKRIEPILKAAGTSLANCLKAQVHIAGAENFADFLDVWNEHVGSQPPAISVTPATGFASVEMILEVSYILLKDGAARKKEIIRADIPEMAAYSPAVRGGELVFSPGILPITREGVVAGLDKGDAFPGLGLHSQMQAHTIFDHAEAIAKAAGTSMKNVTRIDYWVTDIREFQGIALAWAARYGSAPHPFACVVTPKFAAPGARVMADFWFYTA